MEPRKNRKQLFCHYFHHQYGDCRKGNSCKFIHGEIQDFCPNGKDCPIFHGDIICPYEEQQQPCPDPQCSFRHKKKQFKAKHQEQKMELESSDEQRKIIKQNMEKNKPEVSPDLPKNVNQDKNFQGKYKVIDILGDSKPIPKDNVADKSNMEIEEGTKQEKKVKYVKKEKNTEENKEEEKQAKKEEKQIEIEQVKQEKPKIVLKNQEQQKVELKDKIVPAQHEEKKAIDNIQEEKQVQLTEEQEFQMRLTEANQDLMMFLPFEEKLQSKTDLDMVFIMDITGSMGSWVEASKKELQNIITFIKKEYAGTKIRIGFVGYRDHCDKSTGQFKIQEFTEDVDIMKQFITTIQVFGGGDMPEDIPGGFQKALSMQWQARARYAILVADAPCHGKKYHEDSIADEYPKGDPNGIDIENQMVEFAKKNIQFYAIKMTQYTNKMFNILSQAYQTIAKKPINITNMGSSTQQFGFYVACTVGMTIGSTIVGTQITKFRQAINFLKDQKKDQEKTEEHVQKSQLQFKAIMDQDDEKIQKQEQEIIQKEVKKEDIVEFKQMMLEEPIWDDLQNSTTYKAKCYTFFIVKDKNVKINWKKPLLQDSFITTELQICKYPFSQGAMRYAFYAHDKKIDQKIVAKLPKQIGEGYSIDEMKKDIQAIFICQHIVNEFNEKIVHIVPDTRLLLNFVHSFIYELIDERVNRFKYFYGENFIEGQYQKYNNNAGWFNSTVTESSLISQAFSHFSWQLTQGYLMIVDLQGVSGLLTDPQIHCLNYTKFGKGNNGYEGIMKFFLTHKCNQYCKKLGLITPKTDGQLPKDFNFFQQQVEYPQDPSKKISVLCDLCRQPFQIQAKIYYDKVMNSQEKYCNSCDVKRKNTMKDGKCCDCGKSFRSSEYWFLMKRTDFPVRCSDCRRKLREKKRQDLEKQKDEQII